MKYFYGHGPNGRVEHVYTSNEAITGLCSNARRISPTFTDYVQLEDICNSCRIRQIACDRGYFCLACGSEHVYVSEQSTRPDMVVCDDCGARRAESAVIAELRKSER